jgi:hypothetical protein
MVTDASARRDGGAETPRSHHQLVGAASRENRIASVAVETTKAVVAFST